jgi:hypothetical protein
MPATAFELHAGRGASKKWKESIRCEVRQKSRKVQLDSACTWSIHRRFKDVLEMTNTGTA